MGEEVNGIDYQDMAMSLADAIVESDITMDQKEAIFRNALSKSPAAQAGNDTTFDLMVIMDAVREASNENPR